MIRKSGILLLLSLVFSCSLESPPHEEGAISINGTWKLIEATTIQNDSLYKEDRSGKQMIKIINDSHFAFLNHDLIKGQDSTTALFVSGGGRYTLSGNLYTEFLEYCNYREWEGHEFKFTLELSEDTLIQTGIEKIEELDVERTIIEKYVRAEME